MPEEILDQETKPLRLVVYQGMYKAIEVLLVPDSSGKTACFMSIDEPSMMSTLALTLCTFPQLLLEMQIEPNPEWVVLSTLSRELSQEAMFLRDGRPYSEK